MANFFPRSSHSGEDGDGEPDDDAAARIAPETAGDYIVRLGKYVKDAVHQAKKSRIVKDAYKDGLVYQERKELLDGVLRTGGRPWMRKCARCLA